MSASPPNADDINLIYGLDVVDDDDNPLKARMLRTEVVGTDGLRDLTVIKNIIRQ